VKKTIDDFYKSFKSVKRVKELLEELVCRIGPSKGKKNLMMAFH